MPKCPNFSDKVARDLFNTLVERLGGKPVLPEHVQDLRSYFGDLTQKEQAAYDSAYALWDDHETPVAAHEFLDSLDRVEQGTKTSDTERARAAATRNDGYHVNDSAMKGVGAKDFPETPITATTEAPRAALNEAFGGDPPPEVKAAAAGADYWYRAWRWMGDIISLSDANPHIEPLQRYLHTLFHRSDYAAEWQMRAEDTAKAAYKLSDKSKASLYDLIDDYMNERFISDEDREKGIHRKPTKEELGKMVRKSGVDERGLAVFSRMAKDFQDFAKAIMNMLREKVDILPPDKQASEYARINALEQQLLDKPYFPAMRFGNFTVTVTGPEGIKFFRAETRKAQKQMARVLEKSKKPGETIKMGVLELSPSVTPFTGLPPVLLDMIEEKLDLSAEQKRDLQQLKYETAPIQSFTHRFQHKSLVPGYSRDFLRSYANYFYHGSRYLANLKYLPQLEEAVAHLRDSARGMPDGVKRGQIANFVQDHLGKVVKNTRADWMRTRAFAFHMILGFRPASAMTNLTQTILSTIPHVSAEFGDLRGIPAVAKNSLDIKNFYQHMKYGEMSEPKMRAMSELINLGLIRGALAPELNAMAEGRNLQLGFGSSKLAAAVNGFSKLSAMFFEGTEQVNRRVAGMATYDLAVAHPDTKFVRDSVVADPELFAKLTGKGLPHREAAAIVSAARMIRRTQYVFAKEFRPAYQRGLGSLTMVFRLFQHRMLWNMYNFPAAGARTLLIFAALGGMAGIPGEPDINALTKLAAWWMGKDFDLEDEVRKFATEVLDMKGRNMWDDPFTLTNGIAAHGYGIPALLDMMGEWAGMRKFAPELNRSQAVALSNILPIDPYAAFGPSAVQNPYRSFANGVARGTGALGSYAFNVYKALENAKADPEEFRRWERVAPVSLASIGHSIRMFKEGGERSATGAMIQRYDPHDPKDMAEMIAVSMGYQPLRTAKQWTRIMAEQEVVTFWNMKREILLSQYWAAARSKDPEEKSRMLKAIQHFNKEVRGTEARGKAITADTLQKSMQTRATALHKREAGMPLSAADTPLVRSVRKMFPGVEVDQRRVR